MAANRFDVTLWSAVDANGLPLSGATLTFYTTGTTSLLATYSDSGLTTPNTNPVVADANGRWGDIFLQPAAYKVVLKNAAGSVITTMDPVYGIVPGVSGTMSAVSTIAAMTALVKATLSNDLQITVGGYTTLGDGGGGDFRWSSASTATADGGTIIAANEGGVGRWLRIINTPTINPRQFGAAADGTTDDAIPLAAAAATGKALDLGGKSYKTTVAIAVTNSVFNGTLIPTSAIVTNVLTYTGTGARFFGLTFTGGSTIVATAITATATSSKFFIHDNNFSTFKNGGIVVQSGATGFFVTNNTLDACSAISSGGQYGAINCNGVDGVISFNTLTNCTQTGISSFAVTNNRYSNNKISGDGVSIASGGIIIDGLSSGCVITGNVVRNIAVEGIQISGNLAGYLGSTQKHTISNNILIECAYSGITIFSADAGGIASIIISGNYIQKTATTSSAIQFDKATDCVVSGNTIIGYSIGIDKINTALRINCIGNQLETQGLIGIKAWAAGSNITGNNIYGVKAASTGISFNASTIAGDILIADNVIQQCLVGTSGTFTAAASVFVKNNHYIGNTTHQSHTGATPSSSAGNTFNDIVFNGTATLVAGNKTIANGSVAAGEKIRLFRITDGGTTGALYYDGVTVGTSFVIRSTSVTDTSTIGWEFVR